MDEERDPELTLNRLSWWKLLLAKSFKCKIHVGKETRPGWTGSLEFYVFWCNGQHYAKDYLHGNPPGVYLDCSQCTKAASSQSPTTIDWDSFKHTVVR